MKIGFIGVGNMGKSIAEGFLASGKIKSEDIFIYDYDKSKMDLLKEKYGVRVAENENKLTEFSDLIILAVKPNIYSSVLEKIKSDVDQNKIILTIAAGISIEKVENILGSDKKIVRTMPNTPAQILEGMTAVVCNKNINSEEKRNILDILGSFGGVEEIDESLMHIFGSISGSIPALVDIFIEAVADGAVLKGMSRDRAYKIISEAVAGSARMVGKTNKHPGVLKDEVCSPGGTTIEAVLTLEKKGFRSAVTEAIIKCTEKSVKLSEK